MQISDAIALGRMLGPMWTRESTNGSNCAMMMAGLAANGNKWDWNTNLISIEKRLDIPCTCVEGTRWQGGYYLNGIVVRKLYEISAIIHMFNYHVVAKGDWTLDQLIDWIRSVEPPAPVESIISEEVVYAYA